MIDKVKISFKPTKKQLNEIEEWLIEERDATGEGFYCNWEAIASSFHKNELTTISINQKTIGFATLLYSQLNLVVELELLEIMPIFRGKGYCRLLVSALFQRIIEKNAYVVKLQCAPKTSEPVWRHFGFTDFPNHGYKWKNVNKELYKILVPSLETNEVNSEG